ncbi:MAG TPA: hypothetical protein VGO92_07205 [Acidimicrobiales bacterium]|jgi:hypothetical protein|nr:hypothetical protein [Acidimicrobiales bacterium]
MTRYCPSCGAEYLDTVQSCADCLTPLQESAPAAAPPEDHEILVYELNTWDPAQRRQLEVVLAEEGVPYQWEDTDLLVPAAEEARVDGLLDQVELIELPETLEADGAAGAAADEDVDDEAVYQVMSDLFVIADRMAEAKTVDLAVAGDFIEAAAAAADTPAPFGVDERTWQQVQRLAGEISERLEEEGEDDKVIAEAATLRNALRGFV